jgi:hypothetical protein
MPIFTEGLLGWQEVRRRAPEQRIAVREGREHMGFCIGVD